MKSKVFIFSIGLIAGLTVGVLFSVAIKELVAQFKELHISLNRINIRQSQLSQRLDSIQGKLVPDTKKPSNVTAQNIAKPATQNITKSVTPSEDIKSSDPAKADVSTPVAEDDSNIVVMTNQLVSVLSVHLHNNDTTALNKKTQQTDSALASMSEVNQPKGPLNYRIEFWKSPLNYKGYKMSEGKILLYGITPETPVNLTLCGDNYYILVNQTAYRVDFTDDYKPYDRVTDKVILKKLGI